MNFAELVSGAVIAKTDAMRTLTCLVLLAACSCSRPNPSPPPDPALRVVCRTSVADYCAANACDQTLAKAEQDTNLCPATITRCGNTTEIAKNSVDVSTLFFYQDGQLVAIVNRLFPGPRYVCVAGPERFVIPACKPSQTLPACGS